MKNVDDYVENFFLEHGSKNKAAVSAYNRQYYLKNRKLKPRNKAEAEAAIDRAFANHIPAQTHFGRGKGNSKKSTVSEQQIIAAEKKLARARAAAKKLPPDKRNAVEKKIDAAQKKLNKLKKSIKNPFKKTTKVKTTVLKQPVIKDVSRFTTKKKRPPRRSYVE